MRRTKEQAAETRHAILEAAEKLFIENGYESVSLDQIAAAAGVTRGSVHFHFTNKAGLLIAICECEREPIEQLLAELQDQPVAAPLDNLLKILSDVLVSLRGDVRRKGIFRATMALGFMGDEDPQLMRAVHDGMLNATRRVMDAVVERGQLASPWTAASASLALHATMTGLIMSWALGDTEIELDESLLVLRHLIEGFRRLDGAGPP